MFDISRVDAGRVTEEGLCSMACCCSVNSRTTFERIDLLLDSGVIREIWTDFLNECLVDSSLQVRLQREYGVHSTLPNVETGNTQSHWEGQYCPKSQQHCMKEFGWSI